MNASVQWRARRHGDAGVPGIDGNVDSVSYRIQRRDSGSNPTLSANSFHAVFLSISPKIDETQILCAIGVDRAKIPSNSSICRAGIARVTFSRDNGGPDRACCAEPGRGTLTVWKRCRCAPRLESPPTPAFHVRGAGVSRSAPCQPILRPSPVGERSKAFSKL
jgi:hypothetical protein